MSPSAAAESPVLALARELVQRASVTPEDAGCQALLAKRLADLGFQIENMRFDDVDNLYARRGHDGPVLCFAGHTDVVPSGPTDAWRHPPFAATVEDGVLFGRGAADMKGALAAMVCALEDFVATFPEHAGSIAVVLTSDEEGPALNGTRRVVDALAARGERIDWCVVGEPSSNAQVGDRIRIGRRGSLSGRVVVRGVQGHVAYPHLARNPIHDAAPLLAALASAHWDEGNEDFPPTTLQISNLVAGTGANNVIPGELTADFNFRFSTELTVEDIQQRVAQMVANHDIDAHIDWHVSGLPFVSAHGPLTQAVTDAIRAANGVPPDFSTGGGTSDGRFLIDICDELIELGPVGATIHQIDEQMKVAELAALQALYTDVLRRLMCRR